jgi:hypothetical protein
VRAVPPAARSQLSPELVAVLGAESSWGSTAIASYDGVEMPDIGDTVSGAFVAVLLGACELRAIRNTHRPRW